MPKISLACLDMAGTTVQDDGAVMTAFGQALDALHVVPGTPAREAAVQYTLDTMGQSKIEVFRAITGDEERAHLGNRAFEAAYLEAIRAGGAHEIAGALAAIQQLQAAGIKVALTTGFSAETRDALLEALGWVGVPDLVLSPSDVGRGRPYPDMILAALIRLAVDDVREVAVVGDTTSDLLAGHRSGASVVAGVLSGAHSREELAVASPSHLLGSVAELPTVLSAVPAHS